VFTHIQMPGYMDGLKPAKFKDRWPPIKIVAKSGRLRISGTDLPEGGRFLPKPYTPTASLNLTIVRMNRPFGALQDGQSL
jgi:hypothetical protein